MSTISTPPTPTFFEQLFCPVCFDLFEGRVLQCSQGHSLCEICVKKIQSCTKNECPQCRGAFVGTRNYAIEEMVKQLKNLKDVATIKKDDNSHLHAIECEDNYDKEKLNKVISALVMAIPRFTTRKEPNLQIDATPRLIFPTTSATPEPLLAELAQMIGPPQPRGIFTCRIGNCIGKVPVCRMLNHIRTFHIANFTQHRLQNDDDEFVMHYTFKCQNFRQFIHISQYGLFFLIVNVKRDNHLTRITSWVQTVGRSTECSSYTFNLQMRLENSIAHFTDYTYGESSDEIYIESKKQCLYYETEILPKRMNDLAIDVKIAKSVGERTGRRRTITTLMPMSN